MQVVNALIKANKDFDLLVMPGEDHPAGRRGPSAPYGDRKLWDFFVANLLGSPTPDWNELETTEDAGSDGEGFRRRRPRGVGPVVGAGGEGVGGIRM